MLCDPKNVLSRINKNLVYDIINSRENKEQPVNHRFLEFWREFIFRYYFVLIFKMVRQSNFKYTLTNWKNVVNFNDKTPYQELLRIAKLGKVMVSVYEIPRWLAHQELNQYKDEGKSNFLFIMYNPKAEDGKKVTLSYHKSKTLNDVSAAEIKYKQVLTKKSLIGVGFGLLFFFIDWLEKTRNLDFEYTNFILILAGGMLILFDIYNLLRNTLGGGFSDVITSYRKSMSGRVDSSTTMLELEHLYRIERALIAKSLFSVIKSKHLNVNDITVLYMHLSRIYPEISKNYIHELLKELSNLDMITISNTGDVTINLSEELMHNPRVFDERLYELFDPSEEVSDFVYKTYQVYLKTINQLLEAEHLEKIELDTCD